MPRRDDFTVMVSLAYGSLSGIASSIATFADHLVIATPGRTPSTLPKVALISQKCINETERIATPERGHTNRLDVAVIRQKTIQETESIATPVQAHSDHHKAALPIEKLRPPAFV
ncbi:hypothetical protein QYF36_018905 [Acer negundo]|nr:hypothetical protein QYF36_018905 [Acer negundo]